jgi:rod shape determining protein RodA
MIEAVDTRARGLRPRRGGEAAALGEFLRRVDWVLTAAVAGLIGYGLWAIDGITRNDPGGSEMTRQATYAAAGLALALGVMLVDPDLFRRQKRALYVGTLGVMGFVLVAAQATRGSRRWIEIGSFTLQPSEFGKVLFTLFLAAFLADRARRIEEPGTVLTAIGLGLPPILLVFAQPDLGTALVYGSALAAVLFVAGVRWTHLALLTLATALAAVAVLWALPAVGMPVLKDYQVKRLTSFTNPSSDPRGATYNVNQSITSVGAGGVGGRGVQGATQTSLNYLPEHATDFVFASLAEQRGFVGAAILLLLYLFVVWRGLKIVAVARDPFCAIAAGGIVFMLVFQVFVNVGMTVGIAPITGIPLPFLSVGGSSMVTNMLAVGLLQAIHVRSVGPRRPRRRR